MPDLRESGYHRERAVAYAHEWAYQRNPQYANFNSMGGDCTNFVSQCLFAGCGVMNTTPVYGWYYENLNNRAPAWTSVVYLNQFLTRNEGAGPYALRTDISEMEEGDIVQIRFVGQAEFTHTTIIVERRGGASTENILIASHSFDSDDRPLSTYQNVGEFRFLHILGARR